jgi:hypothetical protein
LLLQGLQMVRMRLFYIRQPGYLWDRILLWQHFYKRNDFRLQVFPCLFRTAHLISSLKWCIVLEHSMFICRAISPCNNTPDFCLILHKSIQQNYSSSDIVTYRSILFLKTFLFLRNQSFLVAAVVLVRSFPWRTSCGLLP